MKYNAHPIGLTPILIRRAPQMQAILGIDLKTARALANNPDTGFPQEVALGFGLRGWLYEDLMGYARKCKA